MNLTEKATKDTYQFLAYRKQNWYLYSLNCQYRYTTFAHITLNRKEKIIYLPLN